ncbi:uncharacterized protein [Littorina saxatilis]|uniref:Pulmonary surfactant-associated protein B n=1 Tax=Littorina saxatilis TaxID=31220 RepID=A0AAN9BSU3_9CAEN
MRLFVAAVIFVTAQAASLGSDKCTWGPSYWCSSISSASTCQAFKHCLDSVWKHKLLDVQQTETCLFSQKLVETIRRVLSFKNGNEHATHLVASMCTFIKEDDMRKECKDTVTNYLPQIFKLVESSMEPTSVAAVLGFCKPYDDSVNDTPTQGPYYPPTNQTMCNDCRAFIADLQTLVNQPGAEDQFEDVMENIVCSELGDLEFLCKAVMEVGLPKLYKFIAENDHPEMVCRLGLFCIDTVEAKPKMGNAADIIKNVFADIINSIEIDSDDSVSCSECDKVVSPILAFEKDSYFRTSIVRAIGYMCSRTSLGEEKCQLLADGFIPNELAEMVSHDVNVKDVCTSTLSCHGPWLQSGVAPTPPAGVTEVQPTDFCNDCQRFFGDVRDVLRNNVSAPEAAALAKETLCQQAGPLEFQCNDLMDVAMPTVLDWLARVDSPPSVCASLTLCPKPNSTPKFDLMKALGAALEEKPLTDTFKCDECQILVQDLRNGDRDPNVQKAIVDFFNEICDKLGQEAQQCKALVQQYAPQLFEIVAGELEPSVLCDILLHCTKPEYNAQESDEPVSPIHEAPETVVIVASETHSVQDRPAKKSKKNSAVYAKQEKNAAEKVGASVQCAICRLAMESIDKVIAANATEENLEKDLEGLCDVLPSSVKEPCDQFVKEFTPSLIDLLLQELDAELICNELQICNDTAESRYSYTAPIVERAEKEDRAKEEDSIACQICELVVGSVDILLGENRSEAAIQKGLDDICNILPTGIRPQCQSFVNEYSVVVVQLLLQELDPVQVCITIGLCQQNQTVKEVEVPAVSESASPWCSLCELVVNEVDRIIAANRSEVAVQSALEQVCSLLPETISSECTSFVDVYTPAIVNLLVQEIKPIEVCKKLGVCPSVSKPQQVKEMEVPAESESASPWCSLCELVVNEVDRIIAANRSEEAMQSALEQVCSLLPATISSECTSFVDVYTPAIVNLLVQEIKPIEVCKKLGVCPSVSKSQQDEEPEPTEPSKVSGPLCTICDLVVGQLDRLIGSNKTEAALESALDQVCTFFPGNVSAKCTDLISLYAPAIVNLLVQEVQPDVVCKRLGLCSAALRVQVELPEAEVSKEESVDTVECTLCKIIVTGINAIIGDNRTEPALIHALETVCDVVSGDLRLQCKSEVENYGPAVLDLLKHIDDPNVVCATLRLCAASFVDNASGKKKNGVSDGDICIICQTLANYAAEALKEQATQDEVEKLLDDICTVLPGNLTGDCNNVVEQFTPMILQLLAEKDNPLHICQDMKICPKDNDTAQKAMVGVDACTYGPAFWCASMENARKCGVVEDCVETYGLQP